MWFVGAFLAVKHLHARYLFYVQQVIQLVLVPAHSCCVNSHLLWYFLIICIGAFPSCGK